MLTALRLASASAIPSPALAGSSLGDMHPRAAMAPAIVIPQPAAHAAQRPTPGKVVT